MNIRRSSSLLWRQRSSNSQKSHHGKLADEQDRQSVQQIQEHSLSTSKLYHHRLGGESAVQTSKEIKLDTIGGEQWLGIQGFINVFSGYHNNSETTTTETDGSDTTGKQQQRKNEPEQAPTKTSLQRLSRIVKWKNRNRKEEEGKRRKGMQEERSNHIHDNASPLKSVLSSQSADDGIIIFKGDSNDNIQESKNEQAPFHFVNGNWYEVPIQIPINCRDDDDTSSERDGEEDDDDDDDDDESEDSDAPPPFTTIIIPRSRSLGSGGVLKGLLSRSRRKRIVFSSPLLQRLGSSKSRAKIDFAAAGTGKKSSNVQKRLSSGKGSVCSSITSQSDDDDDESEEEDDDDDDEDDQSDHHHNRNGCENNSQKRLNAVPLIGPFCNGFPNRNSFANASLASSTSSSSSSFSNYLKDKDKANGALAENVFVNHAKPSKKKNSSSISTPLVQSNMEILMIMLKDICDDHDDDDDKNNSDSHRKHHNSEDEDIGLPRQFCNCGYSDQSFLSSSTDQNLQQWKNR